MSYILQALARSERERKQLETRDLGEALDLTPAPPQSTPIHPWTIVIASGAAIAFVLTLLILALNPDQPTTPPDRAIVANTPVKSDQAPAPMVTRQADSRESESHTPNAPTSTPGATAPLQQVAVSPRQDRTSPPAPSSPNQTTPPTSHNGLVSIDDLERVRSLPGIDVTIHVYSDQPERRFVYVNGKRYKEQETIAGMSARVASITREGMVVDLGERRVLFEVRE